MALWTRVVWIWTWCARGRTRGDSPQSAGLGKLGVAFFALNGAFCGWPGRGERLLRAKLFFGEGREPEIKFNRGLSTAARCCPRLLHLKETWQPRFRQPQAGVSA